MATKSRKRKPIDFDLRSAKKSRKERQERQIKSDNIKAALGSFATHLKQFEDQKSLFDLPPEVRNLIYAKVLEDDHAQLSRNTSKKNLGLRSALPRVNKQVRDEFLSLAKLIADIATTVINFNFSHVIAFLNRLSEEELQALPTVNVPSQREISIELIVTTEISNVYYHATSQCAGARWLNRAAHSTKKGTDINVGYTFGVSSPNELKAGNKGTLTTDWRFLDRHRYHGRSEEEARKIRRAMDVWKWPLTA